MFSDQVIVMEPLLDIGTLIPETALNLFDGQIFVFSRDDTKYNNMGFDIKNLLPKEMLLFCVDCLQYLWSQRVIACAVTEKLTYDKKSHSHLESVQVPVPWQNCHEGKSIMEAFITANQDSAPTSQSSGHSSKVTPTIKTGMEV
jgi:hypothetical protein